MRHRRIKSPRYLPEQETEKRNGTVWVVYYDVTVLPWYCNVSGDQVTGHRETIGAKRSVPFFVLQSRGNKKGKLGDKKKT
jgi:hypothetical protein